MNIITPFFESIYHDNLKFDNDSFYKKALELKSKYAGDTSWRCDTYSTINDHNIIKDNFFNEFVQKCGQAVFEFAKHYGAYSKKVMCSEGWINIAEPEQYQEFHIHPKNHFSLVYYVRTPENCGNILFKNHNGDNMFPLPYDELTPANFGLFYWTPKEGDLLIFRSDLLHMVEKNKSKENRVSISMNFRLDD
jgi:uncharacterized protein (TIGR02466 family)